MTMKCTAFFRLGDAGWSETYYNAATVYTDAQTRFIALMNARMALCPDSVFVSGLRISDPSVSGDSLTIPISAVNSQGTFETFTTQDTSVNLAADALLLQLFASPAAKNRKFLRGIPRECITDGRYTPAEAEGWTLQLNAYIDHLAQPGANRWLVRTRPNGGLATYFPILSVQVIRPTTRKAGRPFGLQRGRRPTQASE